MSLIRFFQQVITYLSKQDCRIALAGGLLASYYRKTPRATNDIDILLFADEASLKKAQEVIRYFGLKEHLLRKADLEGGPLFDIKKKSTPICIVTGRQEKPNGVGIGLDILLPTLPWTKKAIERAQANQIDFGFGRIPCLTVEDILISKVFAFKNQKTRFMDLDDIKSIFESEIEMNYAYLIDQLQKLELKFPKEVQEFLPKILKTKN